MPRKPLTSSAITPSDETRILLILAIIQFTHVVDFMLIMPLGPQLMRIFNITPGQFGAVVSSYNISAAIAGLVAVFFIDRFERKRALLTLYIGFNLGTLACAMAPTYEVLLLARMVTGAFGGVLSGLILAMVGDAIHESRRGAAMGVVMSAFSLSSILGVPFGLYLGNKWGWHMPFFAIVAAGVVVLAGSFLMMPTFEGLTEKRPDRSMQDAFLDLFRDSNHRAGLAMTVLLGLAGFSVIPFISTYLVTSTGMPESSLPYVYLAGGSFTFFTMRAFGKMSDRLGKKRVFIAVGAISLIPTLVVTHLPVVPTAMALVATTFFMIFMSGRWVTGMALIQSAVKPQSRGSFMTLNSAIQQMSSGLGSFLAGAWMGQTAGGALTGYNQVGYAAVAAALLCFGVATRVRPLKTGVR